MPVFVSNIIVTLLTKLTSWLFAKGLEKLHGAQQKAATEQEIDKKLSTFKQVYKDAFNGDKVTKEDRKKLNAAISDFLRGDGHGL